VEDDNGGSVADSLAGDGGDNRLFGSHGNDVLLGRGGDDLLDGGYVLVSENGEPTDDKGDDILRGGGGDDILQGTGLLDGGGCKDLLQLIGDAETWGGGGADQFDFPERGGGDNTIRDFEQGKDVISLPPSADLTRSGFPFLPTKAYVFVGREPLTREWVGGDLTPEVRFEHRGGDTYVQYEVGYVTRELRLSGELELTADDFLLGFSTTGGNDAVTGTRFADQVRAGEGDDVIAGLGGADRLDGSLGDDRLGGGAGDDVLLGEDGADTYEGGPGDDLLEDRPETYFGEASKPEGADTYLFAGRFGHDVIDDDWPSGDRIVFRGIAEDEVVLSYRRDDLTVTVEETGDSVLIRNYYIDPGRFELVSD
jgi:Ca2+-binding RTX toxin-like protein